MSGWNGLDFFIFLILTANTVLGMSRGHSREIISMMCLSAALIVMIKFTVPFAAFLNRSSLMMVLVNNEIANNFTIAIGAGPITQELMGQIVYSLSALVWFVGVFAFCEAGLSRAGILEAFSFPFATISRQVGASLGFIRGYIITLILLLILSQSQVNAAMTGVIKVTGTSETGFVTGSFFANLFSSQMRSMADMINSQDVDKYHQLYQNIPYNEKQLFDVLHKQQEPTMPAPTDTTTQPSSTIPSG